MPATEVSPQLRRQLSDEARRILVNALGYDSDVHPSLDVRHLSLPERLQNIRAHIRFEIPGLNTSARVLLIVSGYDYCYRYHLEGIDGELCVLNKAGSTTKWINHKNGKQEQLRDFLVKIPVTHPDHIQTAAFLEMIDLLELLEVFKGSHTATEIGTEMNEGIHIQQLYARSESGSTYLYEFDMDTGFPISIIQESNDPSSEQIQKICLFIEQYDRFDGYLEPPSGIKSDIRVMVDISMCYFNEDWSIEAQEYILEMFNEIDKDDDGFINGTDVANCLEACGHSTDYAQRTSIEMVRLLSDNDDPSEEFSFHEFCGFWMSMFTDGKRVSDPSNEIQMITAFRQLFNYDCY